MSYQVPQATADAHKGVSIVDMPGQFDHRGMVLRAVCDLEMEFAAFLFSFFHSLNPSVTRARADKELFSETGLLGSLARMNRLAHYLGLVDEDEAHDYRILIRLRNMYAHGKDRDQFYRDPDTRNLVRDLRLYKNSLAVFVGFDDQGVFRACHSHLRARIQQRKAAL